MFPLKINEHLWVLGNKYFHIYLIKGQCGCVLVETGISATADLIIEQLYSMRVEPDYCIVTHPHSDHITGLDDLKNSFPRATVIAGKGADLFIKHPKAAKLMIEEDRHMTDAMISLGFCRHEAAIRTTPSLIGCRIVNDGEELNLGDLIISFIEAKGHAPGNILVNIETLNTILVSDSLGNHYPGRGFFPTFFTGFKDYMKTIDRLEKENPQFLGLAHNGFFSEKKEILNIIFKARKAAHDVHHYILYDKRSDDEIANDLFEFYYKDELAIYSRQNILNCCRLLVRRVREIYKLN